MRAPTLRSRTLAAALAAAVALAACAGGDDTDGAAEEDDVASAAAAATDGDAGTQDRPEDASATDADESRDTDPVLRVAATAPDGSTFAIDDFAGSPVLVETFATWCSSCRAQLGDTQAAAAEAGDAAVFLALSVEADLDPSTLAEYASVNGFEDVRFGVLDRDGLVALQERYGGAVLTPPSTPKFRVDADGGLSDLTTGFETRTEILASLGL